ncbi:MULTISPECIES: malonate decarboxylase acyl carrier protein [Xanthomonas]|jgi:malonate decarboxylase delta subunit|uniref:Malonate decarboxylase acyl carrier protein n=6 Tax=Xanthomonas arboricola TaxID=56448 RepID=A0AAP4NMP6_9XANT|nr:MULTISPECIES: malonate decarboxylase acyl carrier protein [Xanthomonas]MEB1610978.1 malonate decarboxylase acyl carrier protein [Xanthomonas campestris pv. campestris]GAE52762.1 malonate decarboxylase subunit delta [Xanthomonas arboricola pv. pruni str. MAFF 311562]GAE57661.1 malonate decarboxylase subunit delta [Xanthomonas arboricola pv. pruni MAFF 301420]AKC80725.1 malonate decarboxylase subunit delta [Xanthomonas arboricola]AKU49802.1 malonate decarboxylase subunit delta [Xanthomonas ar
METLRYRFDGQHGARAGLDHALVGVVASGNLEVLVERVPLDGAMEIEILTAARGFGTIWQAVLDDFAARHPLRDVRISINDVGATPAVVSLRLEQALDVLQGAAA